MVVGTRLIVAVAVFLGFLWPREAADACSCGGGGIRDMLQYGEAAFIGRLVSVETLPRQQAPQGWAYDYELLYTFRVEESFKRRLPAQLKVASPEPGTCPMAAVKGELQAYVIYEYQLGRYASSMCSSVDPVELRAEARPLPPPVDGGSPAFIVGGAFGEVRTIALDVSGRTVAHGRGEGTVEDLEMCPGGRRLVERVFGDDAVSTITVRTLPSLRTLSELPIPRQINNIDVISLGCLDDQARDVALFWSDLPYGKKGGFIWRRDGNAWRRTAVGRHVARAEFIGSTAYLTTSGPTPQLISFDLRAGVRRVVAPGPTPRGGWVLTPDPSSIAGGTPQSP